MLKIVVPAGEFYNPSTSEFIYTHEQTLLLEHSLVSISKWESKWKKPFLSNTGEKSNDEIIDYIRCMTITKDVPPEIYLSLPTDILEKINNYISDTMTATTFNDANINKRNDSRIITAEIIYYWMIQLNIPLECEKWHLNRLLTLIRVCSLKNQGGNKMSKRQVMESNASLNAARRKAMHTKG